MRISDWSSDVCSSDLPQAEFEPIPGAGPPVLDAELDDLTAPIEQRQWVIRRVALVAKVSELIAPPGMGTSSLALLLEVATATGRGDLIGLVVVRKNGRAACRGRVEEYV